MFVFTKEFQKQDENFDNLIDSTKYDVKERVNELRTKLDCIEKRFIEDLDSIKENYEFKKMNEIVRDTEIQFIQKYKNNYNERQTCANIIREHLIECENHLNYLKEVDEKDYGEKFIQRLSSIYFEKSFQFIDEDFVGKLSGVRKLISIIRVG